MSWDLRHIFLFIFVSSLSFFIVGCSNPKHADNSRTTKSSLNVAQPDPNKPNPSIDPKPKEDEENPDLLKNVKIPASLEKSLVEGIDEAHLGESELVNQIKKKKSISFSLITKLFVSKHLRMYGKIREPLKITDLTPKYDVFRKMMSEMESKISEKNDLHGFKNQMETAIGGIPIYNKDFSTIPNVLLQKKLQCYSGTSTFEVFSRDVLGPKLFLAKNRVVIMLEGHILAGYMEKDRDQDWNLVGIETTVKGKAKVNYGKMKNVHNILPMRIYDANLWMILEVLVPYLKNSQLLTTKLDEPTIVKEAMAITSAMYDNQIPISELEKKIEEQLKNDKTKASESPDLGEETGFGGFGVSDVPRGDISRKELDVVPPTHDNVASRTSSDQTGKSSAPVFQKEIHSENGETAPNNGPSKTNGVVVSPVLSNENFEAQVDKRVYEDFYETSLYLEKKEILPSMTLPDNDCKEILRSMQGSWKTILLKKEGFFLHQCNLNWASKIEELDPSDRISNSVCEFKNGERSILHCDRIIEYISEEIDTDIGYIGKNKKMCIFKIATKNSDYPTGYILGLPSDTDTKSSFQPLFFTHYRQPEMKDQCQIGKGQFAR